MKYTFAATITATIVLACSSTAYATNHGPSEEEFLAAYGLLSTTTYGLPATTTTGGIALGVYLTVQSNDDGVALAKYLERNAVAIQADVTLGAGPTIDDLAAAYRVPESNRPSFARLLRANRARLLELADPESLTPERAVAFTRLIYVLGHTAELIETDFSTT